MSEEFSNTELPWHVEALFSRIFAASHELADLCTVPLASDKAGVATDICATGLLLRIGNVYFLLTAAHILAEIELAGEKLFLVLQSAERMPLPFVTTKAVSSTNQNVDLALCQLSHDLVRRLEADYRFLTLNHVWMPDTVLPEVPVFLVCGYPAAFVSRDNSGAKRAALFRYIAPIYQGLKGPTVDEHRDLLLEYAESRICDGGAIEPNPPAEGLSGCGIWAALRTDALVGWGPDQLRLAAIQIRWNSTRKFLRGTKVSVLLQLLWRGFPEVRDAMRLRGLEF